VGGGVIISVPINAFTAIIFLIISLYIIVSLGLLINIKREGCKTKKEIELDFIKNTKHILREQRHDYMNMFQIIYGYLQLNNKDKALEYVRKSITNSTNIGKCYHLSVFSISLLLEKKVKIAESLGIEITLDVDSSIESEVRHIDNEYLVINYISELFDFFIDCTSKNKDESSLFIDIYEYMDKIEFAFSGSIDEDLVEIKRKNINNIVNNITKTDDGYEVVLFFNGIKNMFVKNTVSCT